MTNTSNDSTVRLVKRVADTLPSSRREAEQYIEGGWISVDGQVVEEAGARVTLEQIIALLPGASLEQSLPVTILLHKPAGFNAGIGLDGVPALKGVTPETRMENAHADQRFLKRHLTGLTLTNPLDTAASGLVVFTQDFRIARKLVDEAARIEQEFIVEVEGAIGQDGLALLNHGLPFNGKALAPIKVSWQNETRLRFAVKGVQNGQIVHMCKMVGLSVVSIKRIRIGRVPMAGLPAGQWHYLQGYERF